MYKHLFVRQFENEEEMEEDPKKETAEAAAEGYEFEGYKIEVSERVLLIPIVKKK